MSGSCRTRKLANDGPGHECLVISACFLPKLAYTEPFKVRFGEYRPRASLPKAVRSAQMRCFRGSSMAPGRIHASLGSQTMH